MLIRHREHVNLSGHYYLFTGPYGFIMACKTGPRKRLKKVDEPIQYVPPEEKKTVVESPERT